MCLFDQHVMELLLLMALHTAQVIARVVTPPLRSSVKLQCHSILGQVSCAQEGNTGFHKTNSFSVKVT